MPRKTILVTGAPRGIDKAVAARFAKEGYNVAISCVRREEQLIRAQKEVESFQIPCLAYKGDMGNMACCKELFLKIKGMFGSVDAPVDNAGISYIGLLRDISAEGWGRTLRTNLTSVFSCCELAVPYMISQKQEKIVSILSVWGAVGASCETAYSATRGGINALTKALAKEPAPGNTQINAITYGAIDTEINQWMDEDDLITLADEVTPGRLGRTEEAADLVCHLGYKESYLTRQVIGLDGGWI